MIKFILWTIIVVFLASLIAAIVSLFYKKYRKLGTCYLWWVEFPDVAPVDSLWHEDWCNNYTRVKFVPTKPLTRSFFKRLDQACAKDPCCWKKNEEDSCYYYYIFPERPLDRAKGTHNRKVEWKNQDGTITIMDEWGGDYVEVVVPFKGDTITIEDGWIR